MRTILVMLVLTGCVADEAAPTIRIAKPSLPDAQIIRPDLCALAAELAPDDLCSLICDPDAMKAMLISEGQPTGVCYEFSCTMTDGTQTTVGVCLAPPN